MTAAEFKAMKEAQIQKLAAMGRAWLAAEGKALASALSRQRTEGRRDGTIACLEGQLADVRAAWTLAQ